MEQKQCLNENRKKEIELKAKDYQNKIVSNNPSAESYNFYNAFISGAKYADEHPSDEVIMKVLNAIGYEELSWTIYVKKNWNKK